MEYDILKQHMKKFPIESLKDFLGRDLVESLLEWHTGRDPFAKKARLSDMIICAYGIGILKNKKFRKQLLRTFTEEEIISFKQVLPNEYKNCDNLEIIADKVANTRWQNNAINAKLLRMLAYSPEDIFPEKNDAKNNSVETLSSNEKFYELFDYQYIIRQKALNILVSPNSQERFLIHMPTGTGKTKTAMHIICHHYNYNLKKKGLVIWIAHTTELLQQAYETLVSVWKNIGNGDIKIYKCWGKYEIDFSAEEISGVMICGIQKLQSLMKSDPDMFSKITKVVRLIVYDEAHKAAAPETRSVIEQLMSRKGGLENRALMGLSATPGRTTEVSFDNKLLESMFGNKKIDIDTKIINAVNMSVQEAANADVETDIIKYFQNRGVLSKIEKEELVYDMNISEQELALIKVMANDNGYEDFTREALEIIGRNKNRNLKILQKLRELNEQNKPTIVFACTVKHAQLLSAMLTLENIPNALVIGDMPSQERADAISSFKDQDSDVNILINYEVLTTGFDATNIECVFIARPTQSVVLYSQMLGRGLRGSQMGGKEKCLLIDIKDNLQQFNENMAFSHFNDYWKR